MKRNIRLILVGELLLFVFVFGVNVAMMGGFNNEGWYIAYYLDLPSLLFILLILIPGLIIMGEWKDFLNSFSVGIREFSLLELKNIIGAVIAAQKLTVFAALFALLLQGIFILGQLGDPSKLGPNVAVCLLTGLYAVIVEFFLLPLRLNAERKMNEEMDLGDD